jgi:hypothetical protein
MVLSSVKLAPPLLANRILDNVRIDMVRLICTLLTKGLYFLFYKVIQTQDIALEEKDLSLLFAKTFAIKQFSSESSA